MNAENTETITLEGELTLPRAEEIKRLFHQGLKGGKNVAIAFGSVNNVDLSFLQLCCSLNRSAVRDNKQARIEGVAPKALQDAAKAAGYLHLAGCKHDCDKSCLWVAVAKACIGGQYEL
jgi:ABC-type transporter Mla MlaB component